MKRFNDYLTYKTKETIIKYELFRLLILTVLGVSLTIIGINFIKMLIIRIIMTFILVIIYYCLLLSIYRLIAIFDNKRKTNLYKNIKKYQWKPYIVKIKELLYVIINIKVSISFQTIINDLPVELGIFFDTETKLKRYYINNNEYETLDSFQSALAECLSKKDSISLYSIDDNNPKDYWIRIVNKI
jgi:hypothetical protein